MPTPLKRTIKEFQSGHDPTLRVTVNEDTFSSQELSSLRFATGQVSETAEKIADDITRHFAWMMKAFFRWWDTEIGSGVRGEKVMRKSRLVGQKYAYSVEEHFDKAGDQIVEHLNVWVDKWNSDIKAHVDEVGMKLCKSLETQQQNLQTMETTRFEEFQKSYKKIYQTWVYSFSLFSFIFSMSIFTFVFGWSFGFNLFHIIPVVLSDYLDLTLFIFLSILNGIMYYKWKKWNHSLLAFAIVGGIQFFIGMFGTRILQFQTESDLRIFFPFLVGILISFLMCKVLDIVYTSILKPIIEVFVMLRRYNRGGDDVVRNS